MKSWYFSEQSYAPAWNTKGPVKIDAPSEPVDVEIAHELLNEFLAECRLADELGLNILVNEHHASYTSMSVSCMLTLGILAAQTKRARLLALGVPIMNRMDPVRIAEEIAYVDVLSRGRLEVGLIKGTPFEMYVSNAHPVTSARRYWEAHDLIIKALKTRDRSFSWESEHFSYRNVSVIPPTFQRPHPQIWQTTASTNSAPEAARRDYVLAVTGIARAARESFPLYRSEYKTAHGREASNDRFAYLAYVAVAEDEATAMDRASRILHFVAASERIDPRFINPPGVLPHAANASFMRNRKTVTHRNKTLPDGSRMSERPVPREYVLNQSMFAGTPDQVFEQIKSFYEDVGGFGHLLVQMGGSMTHPETMESIKLFAREVQPRLEELSQKTLLEDTRLEDARTSTSARRIAG